MNTMNHRVPGPESRADLSGMFPLRAIPWVVPCFGVLLLLMTGLVWAGLLWRS